MTMTKAAIRRCGLGMLAWALLAPASAGIATNPIRIAVFPFHTGEGAEARDAVDESWRARHLSRRIDRRLARQGFEVVNPLESEPMAVEVVYRNDSATVELLLSAGAVVNARSHLGDRTPLHVAERDGDAEEAAALPRAAGGELTPDGGGLACFSSYTWAKQPPPEPPKCGPEAAQEQHDLVYLRYGARGSRIWVFNEGADPVPGSFTVPGARERLVFEPLGLTAFEPLGLTNTYMDVPEVAILARNDAPDARRWKTVTTSGGRGRGYTWGGVALVWDGDRKEWRSFYDRYHIEVMGFAGDRLVAAAIASGCGGSYRLGRPCYFEMDLATYEGRRISYRPRSSCSSPATE